MTRMISRSNQPSVELAKKPAARPAGPRPAQIDPWRGARLAVTAAPRKAPAPEVAPQSVRAEPEFRRGWAEPISKGRLDGVAPGEARSDDRGGREHGENQDSGARTLVPKEPRPCSQARGERKTTVAMARADEWIICFRRGRGSVGLADRVARSRRPRSR